MAEERFLRPGILWWALNWGDATTQAGKFCRSCSVPEKPKDKNGIEWTPESKRLCGPVVLIDEIDKADPSVPNGLLESLGNEGFQTAHMSLPASLKKGAPRPLVIITTNEERELPPAFLRRCLVHTLLFPADPIEFLRERARVFWEEKEIENTVLDEITRLLLLDRAEAEKEGLAIPGAAEFLDLARALVVRCSGKEKEQLDCLKKIAGFALKKNLPPRG